MNEHKPNLMRLRMLLSVFLAQCSILCSLSYAQRGEATINYSLLVYNPAKGLSGGYDLSGGGGSIGIAFGDVLTVESEFQGYSSTTMSYHLPPSANSPGGSFETKGDLFSYLFGPQINFFMNRKRVFGEALFGGAHTNAYANLFRAAGVTGLSARNDGFAMAVGGGLDLAISKHVGVRVAQLDYFMTRYEWKPLGINNQSNFRYQAGMVFLF